MFTQQQYLAAIREIFLYADRSFGIERRWLGAETAKLIEQADPKREIYRVDWDSEISVMEPGQTNGSTHDVVCVWLAGEYKSTYEQYLFEKELSEKSRQQSYRYIELRDRLRKKVVRQFYSTGVTKENAKDIELMIDKLIQSRSELVAKQFNISFEELLKADKDLKEIQAKGRMT